MSESTERVDLSVALRDGYLRRVALGPGGEPVECWVHRMRCVLEPGAPETRRVLGLRLEGVRAFVTLALSLDPDEQTWEAVSPDWIERLRAGEMLPPIIESCAVGVGLERRLRERLEEDGSWRVGDPGALWCAFETPGVQVFELRANGAVAEDREARFVIAVAFERLVCLDAAGPCSVAAVFEAAARWRAAWREYRLRREQAPETPLDPQFEWATEAD